MTDIVANAREKKKVNSFGVIRLKLVKCNNNKTQSMI